VAVEFMTVVNVEQ